MTPRKCRLLIIVMAVFLAAPLAASAKGTLDPVEQAYVDEIRKERPDQADRIERKFKAIDGRNVNEGTKIRLKKEYVAKRIRSLESELRLIKKVGNKKQEAKTQETLNMLGVMFVSYSQGWWLMPKRVLKRVTEIERREKEKKKEGKPPEGGLKSAGVSIRGGLNFGGTNVSAKGDLATTTATGNISGSNGITNPFIGLQMTLMMHQLAVQTQVFGSIVPIVQFYAAQNLGGFGNVLKRRLHPGSNDDSFVRFRRGFQAGVALGAAFALTQYGLCGFGSPEGCMDFTLWAGPLLAVMATRVISDERGGGGNYNSFTRNETLLGAMVGAQFSYLVCATCQLPMYLTLGGQLNMTGNPSGTGGRTSPFNFNYDGRVNPSVEALFWVGVAFQLDQLARFISQGAR